MEIDGKCECELQLGHDDLFDEITARQTRSYTVQWKSLIEIITPPKDKSVRGSTRPANFLQAPSLPTILATALVEGRQK